MNPHNVRNAEFKTVRKGFDPDEVNQFLSEVADSLEKAQNHATAMEARARAAVQRAQELAAAQPDPAAPDQPAEPVATPDEAETISRALLLAQRTADTTIAEAEAEAESLRSAAAEESTKELDAARELAAQMNETAKADAEKTFAAEKDAIATEIAEMRECRDLLAADADALAAFLDAQRERIRDTASTLVDLTERVPGGIAAMAAPVLESVAADDTTEIETLESTADVPDSDEAADDDEVPDDDDEIADGAGPAGDPELDETVPLDVSGLPDGVDAADDDPTEVLDATPADGADDLLIVADLADAERDDAAKRDLRFKFSDEG